MILAAEHGRNGERYIVSEKMMTNADIVRIAADDAGVPVPSRSVSLPVLYGMARWEASRRDCARRRAADAAHRCA